MKNISPDSFDIFKEQELAKKFLGDNINLIINSKIEHCQLITKLFDDYDINYELYFPKVGPPERFDLHFGNKSNFQDLFITVALLKNFGLQSVCLSPNNTNKVIIGSYVTEYGPKKYIYEGISPEVILNCPFMLTTNEFLIECFGVEIDSNQELNDIEEIDEEDYEGEYEEDYEEEYEDNDDYDNNYSSNYYEEPDYERDNFDVLTNGQFGNYEDWKEAGGDMDYLKDCLGY